MRERQAFRAALAVLCVVVSASVLLAAPPRTYQVTGPVLSVTDDMIVVQKGADKWEIARDASTKVTGDLKVGSKVTIEYRMIGTSVEVKPAAAAKPAAKPAAKKH